jgi:cell division protein FtsI (penicillin-binding protein 3)
MATPRDRAPPSDSPPLNDGRDGRPKLRLGAGWADSRPHIETVRVTQPDLDRRRYLEKSRSRLVFTASAFGVLFSAVIFKLTFATIIAPLPPHRPEKQIGQIVAASAIKADLEKAIPGQRAMITDRNGRPMAISLNTVSVFADPRQIIDPVDAVRKLRTVLPALDEERALVRLSSEKKFVYLHRQITPKEQLAINNLGIPGIDFQPTGQRHYPLGRTASHVLGGVDVDEIGVAGAEAAFDKRLRERTEPLRLSVDIRVQAVVREELFTAMTTFNAIGGAGIVMDVNTGEILAMVSLPDYDANDFRKATEEERRNRTITGRYEPGSTFKLQTAAMALDYGAVRLWDSFDASRPISIGRFTINDFEGKKRALMFPEVLAYSSNIGAAKIAQVVGGERQRAWLRNMGMFSQVGVELPEALPPQFQREANWKEIATLTVGFGHGISVTPLHVVKGTAAIANGGILRTPTILALPLGETPAGTRIMQQSTSDMMRRLMRLIVTDGFGKTAEVPGYYPGGKTGTAEKSGRGGYKRKANVAAFMGVFPMNAPRYAVYMMLDEAKGNKSTYGYATAGWVAAPAAGKVIARVGPMLGLMPDMQNAATINQALAVPLQPARPASAPRGPAIATDKPAERPGQTPPVRPTLTVPPTPLPPATLPPVGKPQRQHAAGYNEGRVPLPDVLAGHPTQGPASSGPASSGRASPGATSSGAAAPVAAATLAAVWSDARR